MTISYPRLVDLYQPKEGEEVTGFQDGNGFSIIKKYKDVHLSEYRQMIKLFLTDKGEVAGGVNLVKYEDKELIKGYVWVDSGDFKVTNFIFNKEDFTFKDNFFYSTFDIKKETPLSVNDVIKNIEYNHLSVKVRFYQKTVKYFYEAFLKIIFWFGDGEYSYKELISARLTTDKYRENLSEKTIKEDPLFKYFHIHKNLLFFFTLCILIIVFTSCEYYNMDVTQLPVVFSGLVALFLLEKISSKIKFLLSEIDLENGFIQKIFRKSQNQGFKLIIKHKQ